VIELLQELRLWRQWTTIGAPERDPMWPYLRGLGLCGNMQSKAAVQHLRAALDRDFGEGSIFPFGGTGRYQQDRLRDLAHLNTERLAWVDKIIAELSAHLEPET